MVFFNSSYLPFLTLMKWKLSEAPVVSRVESWHIQMEASVVSRVESKFKDCTTIQIFKQFNKYINQNHCSFLNLNNMKSYLTLLPITMHQFKFSNKSNVKWNYPYKTESYLRFLSFVRLFLYIPLSPSSSLPKEFCLSRASSLNDVSTSVQQ